MKITGHAKIPKDLEDYKTGLGDQISSGVLNSGPGIRTVSPPLVPPFQPSDPLPASLLSTPLPEPASHRPASQEPSPEPELQPSPDNTDLQYTSVVGVHWWPVPQLHHVSRRPPVLLSRRRPPAHSVLVPTFLGIRVIVAAVSIQ